MNIFTNRATALQNWMMLRAAFARATPMLGKHIANSYVICWPLHTQKKWLSEMRCTLIGHLSPFHEHVVLECKPAPRAFTRSWSRPSTGRAGKHARPVLLGRRRNSAVGSDRSASTRRADPRSGRPVKSLTPFSTREIDSKTAAAYLRTVSEKSAPLVGGLVSSTPASLPPGRWALGRMWL